MSRIEITDFKTYLNNWISDSRTIGLVSMRTNGFDVLYRIANRRVIRDDATMTAKVARVLKLLVAGPLIINWDYLKEDTMCILEVNMLGIYDNHIKLSFDISVCNGSNSYKSIVRVEEIQRISNRLSNIESFTVSESIISVDVENCEICREYNITTIKTVNFAENKCILEF